MRASFKHSYIIAVTGMASEPQIMAALKKTYRSMPSAPFLPVVDADTGMEKLFRLAHVLAESRRLNSTKLIQIEREEFVQSTEVLVAALTKIPSINDKDAESLLGLGSLSTIASASVDALMHGTTLTLAKANRIVNFFRDENYNRAPFLKR